MGNLSCIVTDLFRCVCLSIYIPYLNLTDFIVPFEMDMFAWWSIYRVFFSCLPLHWCVMIALLPRRLTWRTLSSRLKWMRSPGSHVPCWLIYRMFPACLPLSWCDAIALCRTDWLWAVSSYINGHEPLMLPDWTVDPCTALFFFDVREFWFTFVSRM